MKLLIKLAVKAILFVLLVFIMGMIFPMALASFIMFLGGDTYLQIFSVYWWLWILVIIGWIGSVVYIEHNLLLLKK
jgi:hypothetical protein